MKVKLVIKKREVKMGKDVNVVHLKGHVGSCDFRPNNVVSLNVATNTYYKDKATGEMQSRSQWHKVVCFNSIGAKVAKLEIKKGARVAIDGHLKTNAWKDQNGAEHKGVEIVADQVELLVVANNNKSQPVVQGAANQVQGAVNAPMQQVQQQYSNGGYAEY
jgi:single-strand DNA-binding protein